MQAVKYSIVIPCRNRQPYAIEAVQSILLSERDDVQVILLDNSDDPTDLPRRVEETGLQDKILFVPSADQMLPMRDNWERAIPLLEGEWVTFIGDDDGFRLDGFDVLDWLTHYFDFKIFTWRPTFYKWPCFPESDRGNLQIAYDDIAISVGSTRAVLQNHQNWVTEDKWPNAGPSVYHGAVHRSIIERTVQRYGCYFLNYVVDYASAMSNCTLVDNFLQYSGAVTVMGACGNSNTAGLTSNGSGAKKIHEFFDENPGLKGLFEEFQDSKLHVPWVAAGYSQILEQLGEPFNMTAQKFARSFYNELLRVRNPETFESEKRRLKAFIARVGITDIPVDDAQFTPSARPIGMMRKPDRVYMNTNAFGWTGMLDVVNNLNALQPGFGLTQRAHSDILEQLLRQKPEMFRQRSAARRSSSDMGLGPLDLDALDALEQDGATDANAVDADIAAARPAPAPAAAPALLKARRPTRSVFLNTIPKSGSVYLTSRFAAGLGLQTQQVSYGYFPHDLLSVPAMEQFGKGGAIAQRHLHAHPVNLQLLRDYCGRWVVHFRDPRSVTLSFVHHYNKHHRQGGPNFLATKYAFDSPQDPTYFDWSFERQVDWNVGVYLQHVVDWMSDWMETVESGKYDILVTSYDDMVADTPAFMQRILDFYEIGEDRWDARRSEQANNGHFREGKTDEWRTAFTPEQVERASAMIPDALYERFGWPREGFQSFAESA